MAILKKKKRDFPALENRNRGKKTGVWSSELNTGFIPPLSVGFSPLKVALYEITTSYEFPRNNSGMNFENHVGLFLSVDYFLYAGNNGTGKNPFPFKPFILLIYVNSSKQEVSKLLSWFNPLPKITLDLVLTLFKR